MLFIKWCYFYLFPAVTVTVSGISFSPFINRVSISNWAQVDYSK